MTLISDGLGVWRQLSPVALAPYEWRRAVEPVRGGVYRLSVLSGEIRDMFIYARLRYRERSHWGANCIERAERYYPDGDATLIRLPLSLGATPWISDFDEMWIEFMQRPTNRGFILPGLTLRVEELV